MIYITQLIYVKQDKEAIFHEFENFAIPLMSKYGGELLYRIRPTNNSFISAKGELPYEIHFISFPSDDHLSEFMHDDTRLQYKHLKEKSVRSTLLVKGEKL